MLKNVLFIDDCILELFILNQIQKKYHCFNSITTNCDAKSAMHNLKINAANEHLLPDIIFLDLYMPQWDGYNFLDEFESISSSLNKQIVIHILSSSISPADISRCKKYKHVKHYHVKPITIAALLENEDLH